LGVCTFFAFMDNLLSLPTTASTNDDAYQLALKGAKHGFGVLADTQVAGKGRLGKAWASPVGSGLYCSIVLRPDLPFTEFPKLTLTAGLALSLAIELLCPDVSFGLKWPNDLYSGGLKCGGILVESSMPGSSLGESFVVVGIGLNVNTCPSMFPKKLQNTATSLHMLTGGLFTIPALYNSIHKGLLSQVHIHETQGFEGILKEWRKRDIMLGKEMQWVTQEKRLVTARGLGPDENGQLLAKDNDGKIYEILSGDVQLAKS